MSNDLLEPFDKQKPQQDKEEKLFLVCPHCGIDIPRVTYPEIAHGDFDCPRCGAYRHSFDFVINEGRPGYFMRSGSVIENYVTPEEWAEYLERTSKLKRVIVTIFKDDKPILQDGSEESKDA